VRLLDPPSDQPEIEVIDGRAVAKVSPRLTHGLVQVRLAALLQAWAGTRGLVSIETRFRLSSTPGKGNSFVPDISYVAIGRLLELDRTEIEEPPFAPDVAVEIWSPGDREQNLRLKVERYLRFGASVVLDVRPSTRTMVAYDGGGSRTYRGSEILEHPALLGFRIAVHEVFADIDRLPR